MKYMLLMYADESIAQKLFKKCWICHAERRFSGAKHLKTGSETLQALENAPSG